MTPPARAQAAIELLDQIIAAARTGGAAADTLIARYFKERRYAGARDRRSVRDLVYAAIRRAGEPPADGRAALLGVAEDDPALLALFDGSPHAPAPVAPGETGASAGVVPAWLAGPLRASLAEADWPALLERASLDLRVNLLRGTRDDALAAFPGAVPGRFVETALRLPEGSAVEKSDAWGRGLVEVQDEGSQLIVAACRAGPGQMVVDLCAGAGGKTLGLAATMENRGRLIACDVDRRLSRLTARAARAGATNIELRLLDGGREDAGLHDLAGEADVVLVDAPCSGSGTWRRNPEARWRLTPERLARLVATQAHVLALGAALVRPGGRLVFATCSVLRAEGADQAARFLSGHPGWQAERPFAAGRPSGAGRLLSPAQDGTDGFFAAAVVRGVAAPPSAP